MRSPMPGTGPHSSTALPSCVPRAGTNALNNLTDVVDRETGTAWRVLIRICTVR
jgi:hypothetical protein